MFRESVWVLAGLPLLVTHRFKFTGSVATSKEEIQYIDVLAMLEAPAVRC